MPRKLFLLEAMQAFECASDDFIRVAGGNKARIALLMQGGDRSQKYLPSYIEPWERRGVSLIRPLLPENGILEIEAAIETLHWASGIFIAGGHTPTYRQVYATPPLRPVLHERYQASIPIAGMSAGALIASSVCAIPPEDTGESAVLVTEELGLISDIVVGVHFTEMNMLSHVINSYTFQMVPVIYQSRDA